MTPLGKYIITIGISLWTISTLTWILTAEWQWFAGGLSLFIGSILTGAILSVETKQTNSRHTVTPSFTQNRNANNNDTDNWTQPTEPPPDKSHDPFDS